MAQSFKLADVADVPPGSAKEVTVAGRVVALFNVDGTFHALDGVCRHAGGPLGNGALDGCIVTCPWHGWQFDVTSGRHTLTDRIQQPVFPVEVRGEEIYVTFGDDEPE